ncbi:MAG: DUF4349 domain-containing protein [Spirochaetota bacterium]
MKKRLVKTCFYLCLGFVGLFLFRLGYGYTKKPRANGFLPTQSLQEFSQTRRNYASKKYKVKSMSSIAQAPVNVDQKYEKIASIRSKSVKFSQDEKQARNKVKQFDALIQFEQKSGNKGSRRLHLQIGVPPQNFDALYKELVGIGIVQAKQITKKDKTNEYKKLNAEKASLEKIRTSLITLKNKGGKIQEYMQLENRILEIEQELQNLGVSLGDFDAENEFCTVLFSLREGRLVKISFFHRLKVAFEWTIKYYLLLMLVFFFMVSFAYVCLLCIDRLKLIQRIFKDTDL